MAWLTGWDYRNSKVINSASGAGTGYQIPATIYYDTAHRFPSTTDPIATVSGNPTDMHTFEPVHSTNIQQVNLTIDAASRTYIAYDCDADGSEIRLYYTSDPAGTWTPYSGNPILGPSVNHYRWPSVTLVGGTLHMFLEDRTDGNLERWTSTDGITFTFQETILTGGNEYKNPFIWLNPNDSQWYLYHHDGVYQVNDSIKVRSASTVTGLAGASDTTILTAPASETIAAASVAYMDNLYWMVVESINGAVWRVDAYTSSSPTSGFTACPHLHIFENDEACPILVANTAGTTFYIYTSYGAGTWHSYTRTLTDLSGDYLDLIAHANTDFSDLRFTSVDETTVLDHWVEEKVDGDYANVWIEVSANISSVATTIYCYHGKADATSISNGDNTFTFFDDFSGTLASKWTSVSGTWTNTGGVRTGSVTAFGQRIRATGVTVSDHAIHVKANWTSGNYFEIGIVARGGADESANSYMAYLTTYEVGGNERQQIDGRSGGGTLELASTGTVSPVIGTWYKYAFKLSGNRLAFTASPLYTADLIVTDSTFSSGTLCLMNWDDTEAASFDDMFVRKFAYPEPTQDAWGAEDAFSAIVGTTTWGQVTGVIEVNTRTFVNNWSGTGVISGSGDPERIYMDPGEYMISEVVETGATTVTLLYDTYNTGTFAGTLIRQYRQGVDEATCIAAGWTNYTVPFSSDGFTQIRIEAP